MTFNNVENKINVTSEIGTLRRLLIHSPDSGLGKVVPSKAQDWLFEDIVHLDTIRRKEYDYYVKILLYFLDPGKIKGKLAQIDAESSNRGFFKPDSPDFHNSDKVIELQVLLKDILKNKDIKLKIVASVCAIENCTYELQSELIALPEAQLAKTLICGSIDEERMIFAPIPNFIFTRDIGITINNFILLNKAAKQARARESVLSKYIFFNHEVFADYRNNIIEIPEHVHHFLLPDEENQDRKITLEGGDVMVVSKDHLVIGCSERTTLYACNQVVKTLFKKEVVKKVTVVKIPKKRDFMHIDTVFTQVKRNVWVLLGSLGRKSDAINVRVTEIIEEMKDIRKEDKTQIIQFKIENPLEPTYFEYLEDLLDDISRNDLGSTEETKFIYSGNNKFPYDAREQWTDSCNLVCIKEGVVLGYDRNDKTVEAFKENGFSAIHAHDLVQQLESGEINTETIANTIILMPSAELSRARGGFHCMSMPILRDNV
ncbi:arginine deiminase family protein [Solitalea sp. MAHUQ-68]|uniref:arginine deiminase n=1 Tax=Solitalea agri TaxID=2953739 RepID=A0A9X2EYU7_9SPHI|nr:arginine deiminase family protein [Solitalea agri]MCO4291527.1 arginine deiminase family protein [Solitalea agri]